MNRGASKATVHGVDKSRTRLSDFTFTFHFHALEKEMATHSSVPAWRIPGMGEHGGLPCIGSHRVGHDWCDLAAAATVVCIASTFRRHWHNPNAVNTVERAPEPWMNKVLLNSYQVLLKYKKLCFLFSHKQWLFPLSLNNVRLYEK